MIMHPADMAVKILKIVLILLAVGLNCSADDTITFDGQVYTLSKDTILLDREDIYGSSLSVRTPEEAFKKINQAGDKATLLVAPSVYWIDDPDDDSVRTDTGGIPFAVRLKCESLSLIGLSRNPEDVVFAVNRGQTQGAVGNFTMFHVDGKELELKNITFGNYCNVDLDYPRNTDYNRKKRKDAIVQAQIGICSGVDHLFAENCRFISRLNLCPFVGARRSLYDNCYFECTDDALSGSAVYLNCRFIFFSSKPFYSTSETGTVFLNCDITCLGDGIQYFTKVPGKVTAIDTRFFCENPIEIKWTRDTSDIICMQENISLNGTQYIIDSDRPELGISLSGSPLRSSYKIEYEGKTIYNLPNLLNGDDLWDPKGMNVVISEMETKTGSKLTGLPVTLKLDVKKPTPLSNGDCAEIISTPLLWGGYPSGTIDKFIFRAENSLPVEKTIVIPVSTPEGLSARKTLTVEPNLRNAPSFKRKPSIIYDEIENCLRVDYSVSGKGEDDSRIMWCRIINDGMSPRVLVMTESDAPYGKTYKAKAGDLGNGIMAVVFPKFRDSKCGTFEASKVYELTDPAHILEFPESMLSTDFSDISIVKREAGIPGIWSFDVFKPADTFHVDWQPAEGPGWYFGKGFDASSGIGIVQSEKGARMSYVPNRDVCKDMKVSLIAEPAKSGGQGFGSATKQYMDICVKFDPVSLNGYALRIERTPDHDRAVSFSLIRYDNGKTSIISDEVISNCFRTPCHIEVGITNGILQASAYTEASVSDRRCCDRVVNKVDLQTPVESNLLSGFCIQHTGSTGPSSTLLRDLTLEWE